MDEVANDISFALEAIETEKKRQEAEQALRESEEKFAKAFNSSPDSVTISNIDTGKMLEVNTGFEHMFGYSRDETIGKSSLDLGLYTNPADRNRMIQILKRVGKIQELELQGCRKSGEILTGLLSLETIEVGGESLMITTISDITERKKAEEALRESEAKFRTYIEQAPVAVFVTDLKGRFLEINPVAVNMLGYDAATLKKMNILNIYSEEEPRKYSESA